ncbi:MAG: DUF177 domain-containing protein [Actinomycetota bacterium]
MADPLRALRLDAREILRQPGIQRAVDAAFEPGDLDVLHDQVAGPIEVDLVAESGDAAIDVTGVVRVPWAGSCRRCLKELAGVSTSDVDERYRPTLVDARVPGAPPEVALGGQDDEAYPIDDGRLDLVPMTRETVLLDLDAERLCRPDCAGLCPVCGIDLNAGSCECDTTVRDHRWAALDGLVLDD